MSLSFNSLSSLMPRCGHCGAVYREYIHSPRVLPCGHTICESCLEGKRPVNKKQKCPHCHKKFKTHQLNEALAGMITRIEKARVRNDRGSNRCATCGGQYPANLFCRCLSCEEDLGPHLPDETLPASSYCMKCCVHNHNGHNLLPMAPSKVPIPNVFDSTIRTPATPTRPDNHAVLSSVKQTQPKTPWIRANRPIAFLSKLFRNITRASLNRQKKEDHRRRDSTGRLPRMLGFLHGREQGADQKDWGRMGSLQPPPMVPLSPQRPDEDEASCLPRLRRPQSPLRLRSLEPHHRSEDEAGSSPTSNGEGNAGTIPTAPRPEPSREGFHWTLRHSTSRLEKETTAGLPHSNDGRPAVVEEDNRMDPSGQYLRSRTTLDKLRQACLPICDRQRQVSDGNRRPGCERLEQRTGMIPAKPGQ